MYLYLLSKMVMFHCHVCLLRGNTDEGIHLLSEFDIKSISDIFLGVGNVFHPHPPCQWHVVVVKLRQPTIASGSCIIPNDFEEKISKMCCNVMTPDVTRWIYRSCKDVHFISHLGLQSFQLPRWLKKHKGLSAVILLRRYLQSLSKLGISQKLCPQLSKLLTTTVFWRLGHTSLGWCAVIRYRVRSLGSHQCGYQVWRNQISKEAQEIYVANLERSLHEDSSCESKLQDIFRAAVAALSPPRLLPMFEYGRFRTKGPEEMEGHYGSTDCTNQQRSSGELCHGLFGEVAGSEDPKIQRSLRCFWRCYKTRGFRAGGV